MTGGLPVAYPPELLTITQAAYILSTSERGIASLLHDGKLTRVNDGGKWVKIRLSNVREYIDSLPEKDAA